MNRKMIKTLTMDSREHASASMLILAMALILIFTMIPKLFAGEQPLQGSGKEQAKPAVAVTTQDLNPQASQAKPSEDISKQSSIDFMMDASPIAAAPSEQPITPSGTRTAVDTAVTDPAAQAIDDPATVAPFPSVAGADDKAEVAMLVSEQCDQSGTADDGTVSCNRIYSNKHRTKILVQRAGEGDEYKQQAVIEEYDSTDHLLYKKTIRHRIDYNYLNGQKAKEKELFDIIYQPTGKKTTRELMVYQFFLDTSKPKSLAWTQYKQIGDQPRAELNYHAALNYGEDGSPDRGIAEQWAGGEKKATYLNWDRRSKGYAGLEQEIWDQWESWIRNVALQAYLP